MTVETPPGVLNDESTDSIVQRHTTQAVAGGIAGVCGSTDLTVSQSLTPAMTVRVLSGLALVAGSTTGTQGFYSFYNDAAVDNLAIAAADPTNPRIDRVVAQVRDATYAGSDSDARLFVVTGTPGAVPALPSLPASCLELAQVAVAAAASSITNGNITDVRAFTPLAKRRQRICQVRMSSPQSLTNTTQTLLTFNTEDLDPHGWHSTSADTGRITPLTAGWYRVSAGMTFQSDTDYVKGIVDVQKNGSTTNFGLDIPLIASTPNLSFATPLIQCNGSTDYLTLEVLQTNTSTGANTVNAWFMAELVYET